MLIIKTNFICKNERIELELEYTNKDHGGDFDLGEEKIFLKENYLKFNPEIEFLNTDNDEKIIIKSKKDQSIRKLMEFDSEYKSEAFLNNCL